MIFDNGLEGTAKELYDRLYTTEFDPAALRRDLESGRYDADAVNAAAIEYVDDCGCQLQTTECDEDQLMPGEAIPWIESGHMKEALELLLEFGLDPNRKYPDMTSEGKVIDEFNIMDMLYIVDNGYQGADSLYLLLSHGGDPNLVIGNQHLFTDPYFDLWFDTANRDMLNDSMYNAKIHFSMVLIGFGAKVEGCKEPLEPVDGFNLSELRNHRNYYVGAIYSGNKERGMELCFFDRHTNWEVARF